MEGKLIVISAPSGAGKTTIVRHLLNAGLELDFSVSACSRPKRYNENHGKDYHFFSVEEFKSKIERGEFVEWEEVYPNFFYGTLHSEIERIWAKGYHVIFDVDVIGGLNLKKRFPEETLAIFIMPPSVEELEKRLKSRSTDPEDEISKRVQKSIMELEYASDFDVIVVNDDLENAKMEAENHIRKFLETDS